MGYRDEVVALKSRRDGLLQETAKLERQLARLTEEERELKQQLLRRWLSVGGRSLWRFVRRHLKLALLLGAVCSGLVTCSVQEWQKQRSQRQQLQARLGSGCKGELALSATPAGAVAFIDGLRLGQVPQTVRVCPGSYRLQLVHPSAVPWQQQLEVVADKRLELGVDLVPLAIDPSDTTRSLVFSSPPGALIFIDGEEKGHAPLELRWPAGRPASILLAGYHTGQAPFVHRLRPGASFWIHLQPKPEQNP